MKEKANLGSEKGKASVVHPKKNKTQIINFETIEKLMLELKRGNIDALFISLKDCSNLIRTNSHNRVGMVSLEDENSFDSYTGNLELKELTQKIKNSNL